MISDDVLELTGFPPQADHSGDGAILPTWTAVDANNVKTSRELWESMKTDGWRVDVSTRVIVQRKFLLIHLPFPRLVSPVCTAHMISLAAHHFIYASSIPVSPDRPIEVGNK